MFCSIPWKTADPTKDVLLNQTELACVLAERLRDGAAFFTIPTNPVEDRLEVDPLQVRLGYGRVLGREGRRGRAVRTGWPIRLNTILCCFKNKSFLTGLRTCLDSYLHDVSLSKQFFAVGKLLTYVD